MEDFSISILITVFLMYVIITQIKEMFNYRIISQGLIWDYLEYFPSLDSI